MTLTSFVRSSSRVIGNGVLLLLLMLATSSPSMAQTGAIQGRVSGAGDVGLPGVRVVVQELGAEAFTNTAGQYQFARIAPGTYTLLFSQGSDEATEASVKVEAGVTTKVGTPVNWPPIFLLAITVEAASREIERVVDAPAAVSTLSSDDVERLSASRQLPRLVADLPGVEPVSSGVVDFNLNSRGFNTTSTRGVLTLIDGRDPSTPEVTGYTEWDTVSSDLDEIKSVEFVRGPSAALYGAGAFNGVLNITMKPPKESLGGKMRVTGGGLNTGRLEFREAGSLGSDWYFKMGGSYQASGDFSTSRATSVEYAPGLLPRDAAAPLADRIKLASGNLRFDRDFHGFRTLTFEGGATNSRGAIFTSSAGRAQLSNVNTPWGRVKFGMPGWNFMAYYTGRDVNRELSLASGTFLYVDGYNMGLESQWNNYFDKGKGRVVAGLSFNRVASNSANPQGIQTIYSRPVKDNRQALFGQVDYDLTKKLKGVLSARWDRGTLFDARVSPRAALVYLLSPNHSLRATYNDSFQAPVLTGFFLQTPIAPPVDLSALEAALAPLLGGAPLGLKNVPILAVGNEHLTTQKMRSFEFGYHGTVRGSLTWDVSYYHNHLKDFFSNILPQAGTSLGRLNPSYGPYSPPSSLPPPAAAAVIGALQSALPPPLFAALSNQPDGSPVFAYLSLSNFGRADDQGIELSSTFALNNRWRVQSSYSYFTYDVHLTAPENPLTPNTAKHQAKAGILYVGKRWDASARYRWVNGFPWSSGIYSGPVPTYSVVDASANFKIDRRWSIGVDASNVLNNVHYEMFGGNLLRRRVLGFVQFSWGRE